MLPDSLPLISVSAVQAALSAVTTTETDTVIDEVENTTSLKLLGIVQVSRPATDGFILSVLLGEQRVAMHSSIALPKGTELVLEVTNPKAEAHLATLELKVLEIILPSAHQQPIPNQPSPTLPKSFIEQVLTPFIHSRLAALSGTENTQKADVYTRPTTLAATNVTRTFTQPLLTILNTLNTLGSTTTNTEHALPPKEVLTLLQQWQQRLPSSAQLQQPEAVKQHIGSSGLSYEKLVTQALQPLLTTSSPQKEANTLFKQLLTRNFAALLPTSHSALPSTTIMRILEAVKAKLENPLQTSTSKPDAQPEPSVLSARSVTQTSLLTPPSALQTLLTTDTKAILGRALMTWAQSLTSLPVQPQPATQMTMLYQQLQSALMNIEHEQGQWLQQTQGQSAASASWQLTIPLVFQHEHHPQEVRLVLNKDSDDSQHNPNKPKAIRWRLRLYFDLAELGSLDVDLELQLPKLKASFWSRQSDTLALLNHKLRPLRKQLTELGAEVEDLQVRHGQLPEPTRNKIDQRWVDVHG